MNARMNDILAEFKLFPYIRKGLVSDANSDENGRKVSVKLNIQRKGQPDLDLGSEPIRKELITYGPADIIGIDQQLIIRTSPQKHIPDFESENLAAIEFSRPDFPWMFSPENPENNRVRPWLVLIVVKASKATITSNSQNPLPVLSMDSASEHNLPNLEEAWAWAHVQGNKDVQQREIEVNLEEILDKTPERLISRIVCPQSLKAREHYYACLVPVYKSGVKAGLGEEYDGAVNSLAWTGDETILRLPVYYHWEFGTGEAGDFKTLVRLLEGRPLPKEVGTRKMDVGSPGAGLDFSDASPVNFESALMPPGFDRDPNPDKIGNELKSHLNQPSNDDHNDPVLGPPHYGNNQANREYFRDNETSRSWFNVLNLDPRHRATAGLGTKVIQQDQEHLMHAAWEQVGDLKLVNEYLRQAQLARSAGVILHKKHFGKLPLIPLLQVTHTVQSRIKDADGAYTIAHQIKSGRIPGAFFSGAFQRMVRAEGNFAKRLYGGEGLTGVAKLMEDLNSGRLKADPDTTPPDGMVTPESVGNPFPKNTLPEWLEGKITRVKKIMKGIAIALLVIFFLAVFFDAIPFSLIVFALLLVVSYLIKWLRDRVKEHELFDTHRPETFTGDAIRDVGTSADFNPMWPGQDFSTNPSGSGDPTIGEKFQHAAAKVLDDLYSVQATAGLPAQPQLDLTMLGEQIMGSINPEQSIPQRVLGRLSVPESLLHPDDPIEPILAAPVFPQPMYLALRDLSKDFILSGLDKIPRNTITILQTNRAFIEAYMTGINHEMGRELLWRGFPTELRASYFRQFWDVSNRLPEDSLTEEENQELAKDIDHIHRWRKKLGAHPPTLQNTAEGGIAEPLVLLIRGDLLRRYPNTVLYAVKARKNDDENSAADGSGNRNYRLPDPSDDGHIKLPVFEGSMEPDITFFGFDLSQEDLVSGRETDAANNEDQGWFFVLQEPVSDLNFKLPGPTASTSPPEEDTFSTLIQRKQDAADVAKVIYKTPTLFAIHADDLIKTQHNA